MAILGLMSTESFSAERFTNVRRKVFYMYPNGAAPLTGILSLLKEEDTNDPTIQWYEKRYVEQRSTTLTHSASSGPFVQSDGATLSTDPFTWTADATHYVKVASTANFRVAHVIKITATTNNTANNVELFGVVTEITSTTLLKVRATNTAASVTNGTGTSLAGTTGENTGAEVLVVGSAYSEGSLDISREMYTLPTPITNYTQIFRTPFTLTGTAYKTEAKYDDSGPYKDKAKEHSVNHMLEIEKALIFGIKSTYVGADSLPVRTFGGILYWLALWEAGSTYGNTAATADTDDTKRIISNSGGTINSKTYETYMERLFRVTNNVANEKLCLCGSGHLKTLSQMFRGQVQLTARSGAETPFGMPVVEAVFPYGTVYYRTHPMLTVNAATRYNGLYLDVHAMQWRPMKDRDTDLLKNRQANDADYRKDEWLTEASFELKAPESHMYIKNLQDFTP
jgi:hypothetical protein